MKKYLRPFFALAGGFGLSFAGLGALWAGAAWPYEALMFFPFLLLAIAISRTGPPRDKLFLLIIVGAYPIGHVITMFRDKNDSHLMPILIVCLWLLGILAGHYLAAKVLRKPESRSQAGGQLGQG